MVTPIGDGLPVHYSQGHSVLKTICCLLFSLLPVIDPGPQPDFPQGIWEDIWHKHTWVWPKWGHPTPKNVLLGKLERHTICQGKCFAKYDLSIAWLAEKQSSDNCHTFKRTLTARLTLPLTLSVMRASCVWLQHLSKPLSSFMMDKTNCIWTLNVSFALTSELL